MKAHGTSNMKRLCQGPCKEPSEFCTQLAPEVWVCDACMSRIKALAESKKLRAREDRLKSQEARATLRDHNSSKKKF